MKGEVPEKEQAVVYLAVLELEPGASFQDVKSAYRDLCLIWHPDKNPAQVSARATRKLQQLNAAYTWLTQHAALVNALVAAPVASDSLRPAQGSSLRVWWTQLDQVWKQLFRNMLGTNAQPTEAELRHLIRFSAIDCSQRAIPNLTPLAAFTHLSKLQCYKTPIHSVLPLKNLHALQEVDLWGTFVEDLAPLENLPRLYNLNCNETPIRSLQPLRNLINLGQLSCSGTRIQSLESLQQLTRLKSLSCGETAITSLAPLENLRDLQLLYCSQTRIKSLQPLWKLPKLHTVFCQNTQVPFGEIWKFKQDFPACNVYY